MSLQGSLDTFALPDVLVLLAGSAKTGELRVTGSRTAGIGVDELAARVWFQDGRLAGHDDPGSSTITDAVFALLRLRRGSFDFTPGPVIPATDTCELGPVLDEARARLAEWAEIEDVVPSPAAWLRLVERAPRDQITVTTDQWRLIVAIGSGRSVSGVIADLDVGELPGFRAVKDLVVDGLVTVEAGIEPAAHAASPDTFTRPVGEHLEWATPVSSWGKSTLATTPPTTWTEPPREEAYGALRVVPDIGADGATGPAPTSEPEHSGLPDWRAEMADIHDLDSFVVRPPVAAPRSGPDDNAELAVGEEVTPSSEEDEPLNRGLLLKFLSSVRN